MALTGLKCEIDMDCRLDAGNSRPAAASVAMWDEMAFSIIAAATAMQFLGRVGGRVVVWARMQPILNPCLIPLTMKVAKSLSGWVASATSHSCQVSEVLASGSE